MKSKPFLAGAFACLLIASSFAASAGNITFDASGTFTSQTCFGAFTCTPTLGGTIVIDPVTGLVDTQQIHLTVTVPEVPSTTAFTTLKNSAGATFLHIADAANDLLNLALPVATLSGYSGGQLCSTTFNPTVCNSEISNFALVSLNLHGVELVSGSLTAEVPGPIAGAGLPGLILACAGLLGWCRRRRKGA